MLSEGEPWYWMMLFCFRPKGSLSTHDNSRSFYVQKYYFKLANVDLGLQHIGLAFTPDVLSDLPVT